jgi:hypothetical protein
MTRGFVFVCIDLAKTTLEMAVHPRGDQRCLSSGSETDGL